MGFNMRMTRAEASKLGAKKAGEKNTENKIKREKVYNRNPNHCNQCKKVLIYAKRKNIFCNHSCSQTFNNRGVRRNGLENRKCKNCGEKVKTNASYFCSIKCVHEYRWKEWCERVENLGFFEGYDASMSGGNAGRPKKYMLQKQKGKCAICGIDKWLGKAVPFVLDHINGDSNDWKIENTRVICRNCDGQLDTYCGKNMGKSTRPFVNSRGKDGIYKQRKKQ